MKTIVVQAWFGDSIGDDLWLCFYKPCISSVMQWAEQNGWDYRFMRDKDIEHWDWGELTDPKPVHATWRKKLEALNHPDYDRIVWVDCDIYVWGNVPIDDSWLCISTQTRQYNNQWIINHYPQAGFFWGGDGVHQLYQWAKQQSHYMSDETLQLMRLSLNYGVNGMYKFDDEAIMTPWIEQNHNRITLLDLDSGPNRMFTETDMYITNPPCMVHFATNHKYNMWQCFQAYKLIHEHGDRLRAQKLIIS